MSAVRSSTASGDNSDGDGDADSSGQAVACTTAASTAHLAASAPSAPSDDAPDGGGGGGDGNGSDAAPVSPFGAGAFSSDESLLAFASPPHEVPAAVPSVCRLMCDGAPSLPDASSTPAGGDAGSPRVDVVEGMEWVVELSRPMSDRCGGGGGGGGCGVKSEAAPDNKEETSSLTSSRRLSLKGPAFWDGILSKESVKGTSPAVSVRTASVLGDPPLPPGAGGDEHVALPNLPPDCLLLVCAYLKMADVLRFSESCARAWAVTSDDRIWAVFFHELFCPDDAHTVSNYVQACSGAAGAGAGGPAGKVATHNAAVHPFPDSDQDTEQRFTAFHTPVSLQVSKTMATEYFKAAFLLEKMALNERLHEMREAQARAEAARRRVQAARERVAAVLRTTTRVSQMLWVVLVLVMLVCGTVASILLLLSSFGVEDTMRDATWLLSTINFLSFCLVFMLCGSLAYDVYDVGTGRPNPTKPLRLYIMLVLDIFSFCISAALFTDKLGRGDGAVTYWSFIPVPFSLMNVVMIIDALSIMLRSLVGVHPHHRLKESVLALCVATASSPAWLTFQLAAFSKDRPDKISCHGSLIPMYVLLFGLGTAAVIAIVHGVVRSLRNKLGRECVVECMMQLWYNTGASVFVSLFVAFVLQSCTDPPRALACLSCFMLVGTSVWWMLAAVLIS